MSEKVYSLSDAHPADLISSLYWKETGWPMTVQVGIRERGGWKMIHVLWVERSEVEAELARIRDENHAGCLSALKTRHTRELLTYLDNARKFGGWFHLTDDRYSPGYGVSYDDIKAELATRPHIPNKKEARALRQEAALRARKGKRG